MPHKKSIPPDNSKITSETTYRPNITDTFNYVPILGKNIYQFMTDAFHGTGGFRDGRYLVPHLREQFYDNRRDLNFYKNYVAPIVRAKIDGVTGRKIKRTVTMNGDVIESGKMVNDFLKNVDNAGIPMQPFVDDVLTVACLHGVTFVVVDNFRTGDQPPTLQEALDGRIFPYVYIKSADQVDAFKADIFGNLEWIRFVEDPVFIKNERTKVMEKQARFSQWDDMKWHLGTKNEKKEFLVLETFEHDLGKIPVIPVFTAKRIAKNNILVNPPLYDIAKINHAIYNKDSEVRSQ